MKKIIALLFFSTSLLAQTNSEQCLLLKKINKVISEKHFKPKPIDDSLSVYIFKTFIDAIDDNRVLFTKTEFDQLSKHKFKIDDYINGNNCAFMDEFIQFYVKALQRKKTTIEKIEKSDWTLNGNDTLRFLKKAANFELTEKDFDRILKKRIRFDVMENIASQSKNIDSLKTNFATLEKEARKKVLETAICKVNNELSPEKGIPKNLWEQFLDIYCNYFDSHTNYLSYDDKNYFLSSVSTSNFSLGLNVSFNEKEEIVINEIVPGSPAFMSEQLTEGDVILKIASQNGESYSVSCTSIETIANLIYSDTYKEIKLTVRKIDGKIIEVQLVKEHTKATTNSVYSFIIKKNGEKIGYIKIPSFYSDFENHTIQGCADDVEKEIVKLKKDSITGLIIDLEDNGGGSMEEATKLGGMFIDVGPLSVLVDGNGEQTLIKDFNRGLVFSGPMVVLINGNSASASEYFSSLMQDYKRAVVIGTSSLGKASMQVILPLDEENQQNFIKITIEKFYRVSGESCQIKGVVPDIFIPKLFDDILKRENKFETSLKNEQITINLRYRICSFLEESTVLENSKKRVSESDRFKEIKALNDVINTYYQNPKIEVPMVFESVFKYIHSTDKIWETIKKIEEKPTNMTVSNTSYETEILKYDISQQKINTVKMDEIKNNPYIEEGFNILENINQLKN